MNFGRPLLNSCWSVKMSAKDAKTDLDAGVLNNSEWVKRWGVGDTAFHQGAHDPLFDTHGDMMFEGGAKSVFAPLCGKSLDLIWMYNRGHTVVGVEIAEQAVQELFSENKLDVQVKHVEGVGPLYKSIDGRLQVYVGDLFDLTKDRLGEFDRVWDSRSIVAINVVDQERYRDLLLSFLKKDGQYYLMTIDYDPAVWPGPPHNITDQRVRQLYGEYCNIEVIQESNLTGISNPDNKASGGHAPPAKPKSAGAALRTSSYLYDRYYKMTFK
ncbi:thiopurine S-methyltransferase-like isoform X1 [Dreissena polymorpha]|nr:thiopurine S-methyltransferase-like isoform X1 [Dreissena polymorpha]